MMKRGVLHELFRKSIHLSWLFVFLAYLSIEKFKDNLGILFLVVFLLFSLIIDIIRVDLKHKFWYNKFLHSSESSNLSTPTVTILGILLPLILFQEAVAHTAIFMMIFGDLASGLSDIFLKGRKIMNKNLSSFFIGLAVNLIIGFTMITPYFVAFFMALTASIMEMASTKINDNLTMPLFAGFVGHLLLLIL